MIAAKLITAAVALAGTASAAPTLYKRNSGRGTFFDVGLGACGWNNVGSDYVVAIPTGLYGNLGSRSSHCGQQLTISYGGNTATATVADACPSCSGEDLDMSRGLFSALTNGNMDLGVIQMSWNWGSSSGSSNNNNNNGNQRQAAPSSSSSSPKPAATSSSSSEAQRQTQQSSSSQKQATPYSSSSSSAQASPSTTGNAKKVGTAPDPAGSAGSTVEGVPLWWAEVGTAGCDVTVPENAQTAAVAQSDLVSVEKLADTCGKWIEVKNPANNKTVKAVLTTYIPGGDKNSIVLGDAYKAIADMSGAFPAQIEKVQWGFINNTQPAN